MDGRLGSPPTEQDGRDNDHHSLFVKPSEQEFHPRPEPPPAPPKRRRRWPRALLALALAALTVLVLASATLYLSSEQLGNNVARLPDVFSSLDRTPRPPPIGDRVSFLLVGTDSRPDPAAGVRRGDMLMLARIDINQSRTGGSVISIPRDSWVDIPGRGPGAIDAAYAAGGPPLLIQTVEQLTKARINHFAIIDFAGFRQMVDAVGGIDVQTTQAVGPAGVRFVGGPNHLDGVQALAYVRQLDSASSGGYLGRAARMQNALRALMDRAASSGLLADPIGVYQLLDAVSRSMSVDDTLSNNDLRQLGLEMRSLRSSNVQFVIAPVNRIGRLDDARAAELWDALRNDAVGAYIQRHPSDTLGQAPR
jgi:LCP family protein required for cell wall assembly